MPAKAGIQVLDSVSTRGLDSRLRGNDEIGMECHLHAMRLIPCLYDNINPPPEREPGAVEKFLFSLSLTA
jgi:hypothetical protein